MLSYIERDGDKIKYIALYQPSGKILAISLSNYFTNELHLVDVDQLQQSSPQLFQHIQNKVNESLGETPHLNS